VKFIDVTYQLAETERNRSKSMRVNGISLIILLALFVSRIEDSVAANPSLIQAKKEADAKGYIFYTTHDQIVNAAKKEGKLRVSSGLESANFKPLLAAFKQKYPFVTDIQFGEVQGTDSYQRFILEMKAGASKEWDVPHIPIDFALEYPPYLAKHDILGMAKQGVLKIDPRMIHPVERNMVAVTSNLTVVPYNKKLISSDKVPTKWEDFLKPEFKGKQILADIRPLSLAGLVPAWGLEKTLVFAGNLAAQQPVWGSGATRLNTRIASGEYPVYLASNFSSVKRAMSKDPTGTLSYKIVEPIPTRVVDQSCGILKTSDHPHAALLWIEFLSSREGQEIIDKHEPLRASLFTSGSATEQITRGKQLSIVGWDHIAKYQEYNAKIFAAWGFPNSRGQ
jgi:iron(III) transport system substrate-binding protein